MLNKESASEDIPKHLFFKKILKENSYACAFAHASNLSLSV